MKINKLGWLLGLGLAAAMSINASAQRGGDRHHGNYRGDHRMEKGRGHHDDHGKRDLASKVYRVTNADSVQQVKMKPAIEKTSKRLEALRVAYQKQEKRVMDSLALQVKPYLKEEQVKRLSDWKDKTGKK